MRDDPAWQLNTEDPERLARAVADARRGIITHVAIGPERVAAIVPESVIELLRTKGAITSIETISS